MEEARKSTTVFENINKSEVVEPGLTGAVKLFENPLMAILIDRRKADFSKQMIQFCQRNAVTIGRIIDSSSIERSRAQSAK